jgi:hypothetical protein
MNNEKIISILQKLRDKIFHTQWKRSEVRDHKHECNTAASLLGGQLLEVEWYLNTLLLQLDGTLPDNVEYVDFEHECCKKLRTGENNEVE